MQVHIPQSQVLAKLSLVLDKATDHSYFRHYATWSGIHGGYGFYSPSVGSNYHLQFHRSTDQGDRYYNSPGLYTESGRIRYQSFLDIGSTFLERGEGENKENARMAVQLATNELARRYPTDYINSIFMSKRTPSLSALQQDQHQKTVYISLYRYAIKRITSIL